MQRILLIGLFLVYTVLAFSQNSKKKETRIFAQAGFGQGNFYPALGTQIQLTRNTFIQAMAAYGTTGQVHLTNTYFQNADGSFSPEKDLGWFQEDSSYSPPMFSGLREQLDLKFQALSVYAQYQVLLIGYVKNKNRFLSFVSGGVSCSEVWQTGSMNYLDLSGNVIGHNDGAARFHSFSPDLELTMLFEHKSGFGIRAGGQLSFGFPLDEDFHLVHGTSPGNLYSGMVFNAYTGLSFRF